MTLKMVFNPARMERLVQQNLKDPRLPGWSQLMNAIYSETWNKAYPPGLNKAIKMAVEKRVMYHLMNLAASSSATEAVKALAFQELSGLIAYLDRKSSRDPMVKAHY